MVALSEFVEGATSSSKYDVFLSYRGSDTRRGFTNYLYQALVEANISTFLDEEEVETGVPLKPELESVIKASRASIIVLSRNYATSSWCLDELVQILEQRKSSNQIVIPIFYHVEPTDIRKQQSTFGDAMAEHQKKMERETDPIKRSQLRKKIDQWTIALTEIANLKGENASGRRETDFVEEIVENIYNRLHGRVRGSLPQLIGMENSIKSVTSWLHASPSATGDILSVLGMGGIGKTSLAKYIYKSHFREFEASSYVEDISRICANKFNGLLDLQKQLCDDISKRSSNQVHDLSTYTLKIENALARKKVLLVLDDVDSLDQLDALLGSKGFHPGSKVIITTRDASLTKSCALFKTNVKPKHANHELRGLRDAESRQLLCNHAFMSHDPKAGYEEVSSKILKYCQGHPLALKVLGKTLHNKDVDYWQGQIERLKKENGSPVSSVLRLSLHSLPSKDDEEMFKHIACFFVGIDRYVAETILQACDINTSVAFVNLIGRYLLSIGDNKELLMHPLLQEMGRFIVLEESPNKPWKRSRLWCHDESFEVLKRKKGTEDILGLTLDTRLVKNEKLGETVELKTDALGKMKNLKLLQLNFVKLSGSYENFSEDLRWLCMHGFPLKSIPSELPMENLVALDMSYSNLESIGVCSDNPQHPHMRQKSTSTDKRLLGSLKILNLSFCVRLRSLCGFDGLPALERLIVKNCINLLEICESVEQCAELVHVDLRNCNNLQKGPNIGNLKNLKTLFLDGCDLGEPRISIRNTDSHASLKANKIVTGATTSSSEVMKTIPIKSQFIRISLPRSLVKLSLANNNLSNKSCPMDFSGLSMLKELCLDGNPFVSLPDCVRSLPRLEKLCMKECKMLKSVEHPPHTLTQLDLSFFDDYNRPSLEYVVFDPEMSPLRLSLEWKSLSRPSFEIQGMIKIQPMKDVKEKLLCSLGWTKLNLPKQRHLKIGSMFRELEGSEIQMYYEFGIFSTFYGGEEIPNWVIHRSKGGSISFTIPSMPNWVPQSKSYKLKGLNFCFMLSPSYQIRNSDLYGVHLPMIEISNMTKNLTWMYHHYVYKVSVGGECIILLSHWMFGGNEMEGGDHVTITLRGLSGDATKECGVSFVYDYRNKYEEDVLGYYKSWNHIIGRDLTGFQTTTGEYLLRTSRFWYYESDLETYGYDGVTSYIEAGVRFRALSQRKSNIWEADEKGAVKEGKKFGLVLLLEERRATPLLSENGETRLCNSNTRVIPVKAVTEDGKNACGWSKGKDMERNEDISTRDIEKGNCLNEIIFTVGSVKIDSPAVSSAVLDHPHGCSIKDCSLAKKHQEVQPKAWKEHIEDATRNLRDTGDKDHGETMYNDLDQASKLHWPDETKYGSGKDGYSKANRKLPVDLKGKGTNSISGFEGFNIPESKRKKKLWKTAEDVIHELHQPLSKEDSKNFNCGPRHRESVEGHHLESSFVNTPNGKPVVNFDKGKAFDATNGMSESKEQGSWTGPATKSKLADYSNADFYRLLRIKASEQAALMDEAANRGDCLGATKLECVRLRDELAKHKKLLAGYEESQKKTNTVEAERSVLIDCLSRAEVARAKAESELERSEALRADADRKLLSLEASNALLVEKVAMLEAVDAERVAQLEVAREDVSVCRADLEWVLQEGVTRCFDKVLESEPFLRAYKRVQKACTELGIERGCRLMRDRFQLAASDAELPVYKSDTVREMNEACSSFAETNFLGAAGLGELSVDALHAFCLSSDEESD